MKIERLRLPESDLVELDSYHVDIASQLGDFRAVKERYIRSDFPAWTIMVSGAEEITPKSRGVFLPACKGGLHGRLKMFVHYDMQA
ncbi:hypothetical protein ACQKRQ_02745 [Paraburkholderia sp. NPDC080076]|uniref:hypothetical protein n=1 Tax=Paraburkholderia sp. NPDC080076 TaxID=3390605 RepID=UPI003D01876A